MNIKDQFPKNQTENKMKLLDTLSKTEQEVDISKKVKIYLCGVTVYDESHIGHARTIIVFDVLRKHLEDKGIEIEFIQNFTDVDDKIINKANSENKTAEEISTKYIENYFNDFDRLNVKHATKYPKATEHIEDIIEFIEKLIVKDVAYATKNGVYFSISKFSEYGKLSKKKINELQSGSRIEIDEQKKDPLDFAVWKLSDIEPTWKSPWGNGRPGWHIECSAMSIKYLGENFDIHGGGRDLIFPHHENEIAQSESCTGIQFAKIWMHVGMVTIDGEKMSKSIGNIKSIKHVLENWGPNIIRLFCLSGHYSKPIDYSEELLMRELVKWNQIRLAYYELMQIRDFEPKNGPKSDKQRQRGGEKENIKIEKVNERINKEGKNFDLSLEQNMNTHLALQAFYNIISFCLVNENKMTEESAAHILPEMKRMMGILGLVLPEIDSKKIIEINQLVRLRNEYRNKAKKNKNYYKDADNIRDKLNGLNIETSDRVTKTVWMYKENIKQKD